MIGAMNGPDGFVTQSKKLSEFPAEGWKIEDLDDGEYTVTESGATVEGYSVTTTYSVKENEIE